jgi:hypothetical protein
MQIYEIKMEKENLKTKKRNFTHLGIQTYTPWRTNKRALNK